MQNRKVVLSGDTIGVVFSFFDPLEAYNYRMLNTKTNKRFEIVKLTEVQAKVFDALPYWSSKIF